MEFLKEFLLPKTFNRFSYVANVFWISFGGILFVIFLDMEINESRSDFVCGSSDDNRELIRGMCWEKYKKQINKFGIPMYGFLVVNFCVTASVWIIYSQAVKSRVNDLSEERTNNGMSQTDSTQSGKKLFKAYFGQLVVRIFLGISFVLVQALLLYPRSFPSVFHCNLAKEGNFTASRNVKQAQTPYQCNDQRAGDKTFWAYVVIVVTGTFTLFVLFEMLYILIVLPRKVQQYKEDEKFHKYYLKSIPPSIDPRSMIHDQPDARPRPRPFRPHKSKHFSERLERAKSERRSFNMTRQHDFSCQGKFAIQNLTSQKEYVVTISVSPTCECEDFKKSKGNELCKHIIWIYLYQLQVDEEHCLIQQIELKKNEVMQILEIPRVKAILSKDKRNSQRRTWYLSRKERKPGKNPCCKAFRCKKEISPGELCVFVEGLQVVQLEPPKFYQTKFYFCPQIACLQQFPLWSNLAFPTVISAKNDVSPSQIEKAKQFLPEEKISIVLSEDDLRG